MNAKNQRESLRKEQYITLHTEKVLSFIKKKDKKK
jgi:hypothetical protein